MAKFIEINADGLGGVTVNIDSVASIANTDGGTMVYLNARYPNGHGIAYFVKTEYKEFLRTFKQNVVEV